MKKTISLISMLCFIFVCAFYLSSCGYSKTDLTKDNFYDYFERFESGKYGKNEKIDDYTFSEPAGNDLYISAMFRLKDSVIENNYFSNVKIEFEINLYYGLTSKTKDDKPSKTVTFTSDLHYNDWDGKVSYPIGVFLTWYNLEYYEKSGKKTGQTKFEIPVLKSDIIPYIEQSNEYTNYYREIIIKNVSGSIESGGLTSANDYHCN